MKNYRITKYNPENRNSDGHYQVDEWTCPSEVGKVINGSTFEKKDYFEIESRYVEAVITFMESMSIGRLRIVNLNTNYMNEFFAEKENHWLMDNKFKEIELFEDKSVDIIEVAALIKMNLRNFMGCRLEIAGEFRVRFGFDYYMYIRSTDFNSEALRKVKRIGLFVEELKSSINNPNYEFYVSSGKKDQEFVEDEYPLTNMSCDKIRATLGFSIEHPCNHCFEITKDNCSIFVK